MTSAPPRYPCWLPPMTLGERIVSLRKARGWTMRDLAAHSGMNYSVLSYAENGRRGLTLGCLNKVAKAFKLTPAELLEGVDLSEWERSH